MIIRDSKKILMIHPHDIFSPSEPWTIRIEKLASGLSHLGVKVILLHFPIRWEYGKRTVNFKKIKLSGQNVILCELCRRLSLVRFFKNAGVVNAISRRINIIHLQKCFYYTVFSVFVAKLFNKIYLHWDWDDDEYAIFHFGIPASRFIAWVIWHSQKVLAQCSDSVSVSSDNLEKLAISFGVDKDRILKIPVGADKCDFDFDEQKALDIRRRYSRGGHLISYIGQLHGAQYVKYLLEAMCIVREELPNTRLLVVGEGALKDQLVKYSEDLKLQSAVVFTGSVDRQDIGSFLRASDLAIACFEDNKITRSKSPLKVAEYLLNGIPIVASCVGEVPFMAGGAACLVSGKGVKPLAKGISSILKNPALRYDMSTSAISRADDFSWNKRTKKLYNFLRLK